MEGDFFMKKYKKQIFGIIFIIFTIVSIAWSFTDTSGEKPKEIVIEKVKTKENKVEESKQSKTIVDVKGAVNAPGVYELTEENNVIDAINAAGGLREDSDTSNINLSKKLKDEMVIIVYTAGEVQNMKENSKIVCPKVNDVCVTKEDEKAILEDEKNTLEDSKKGIININTATKEELMTLPGVGESKANLIIEYREKNGNFITIEDIKNVTGIGDSLFEKIKDSITV